MTLVFRVPLSIELILLLLLFSFFSVWPAYNFFIYFGFPLNVLFTQYKIKQNIAATTNENIKV